MASANNAGCHAAAPHLTALADGELSEETADAVRAHLDACSACARTFQGIAAVGRLASTADAARAANDGDENAWVALRAHVAPAAFDAEAVFTLRDAVTELRAELRATRAEMAALRAEIARQRSRPTSAPPRLFPYSSPSDPPVRLT